MEEQDTPAEEQEKTQEPHKNSPVVVVDTPVEEPEKGLVEEDSLEQEREKGLVGGGSLEQEREKEGEGLHK